MEFYKPEGLKTIALLLDDLIEKKKEWSQNALAEASGVSSNTIKNIRRNRLNTTEILHDPHPTSLLCLAPYVTNPLTGNHFDPEDFLRVARSQLVIPFDLIGATPQRPSISSPAVEFIRAEMRGKTEAQFAKACDISLPALREILSGRMPTWVELLKLGSQLFEDKNPEPLARLYGVNVNTPIANGARIK